MGGTLSGPRHVYHHGALCRWNVRYCHRAERALGHHAICISIALVSARFDLAAAYLYADANGVVSFSLQHPLFLLGWNGSRKVSGHPALSLSSRFTLTRATDCSDRLGDTRCAMELPRLLRNRDRDVHRLRDALSK